MFSSGNCPQTVTKCTTNTVTVTTTRNKKLWLVLQSLVISHLQYRNRLKLFLFDTDCNSTFTACIELHCVSITS